MRLVGQVNRVGEGKGEGEGENEGEDEGGRVSE